MNLRPDCARCVGLCCVVPAFAASADFALDKPAGRPCPHLHDDFRCGIHDRLRQRGFPGCVVYDCFGAGQQVTQVTFRGGDWRAAPGLAERMFAVFPVMRHLHELLWYLNEALALHPAGPVRDELRRALAETEDLTCGDPDALLALDVAAHRDAANVLLVRTSEQVRNRAAGLFGVDLRNAGVRGADLRGADLRGAELRGADLVGKALRGADLRGASLRGASLVGADLRGADLRMADLTGADLRAADLRGADLRTCLFLTQAQLEAAVGNAATRLPPALVAPAHWPVAGRPVDGPVDGPVDKQGAKGAGGAEGTPLPRR